MFFYKRNHFTLKFRNFNKLEITYPAYYDAPLILKKFQYTPKYPYEDLREYYKFTGWYYDPYHIVPVDYNTARMPNGDETLYANWSPKVINVSFYPTYNDYYDDTNRIGAHKETKIVDGVEKEVWVGGFIPVEYGDYVPIQNVPANIEDNENTNHLRPDLTPPAQGAMFAGWYYLRDNIPVRFNPEDIPVTALNQEAAKDNGNLKLFAEWVTKDVAKYKISYVEKGTNTEVAPPTIGRSFLYKTKTFDAMCGDYLNEEHAWRDGEANWWPTVNSHSLIIKANRQGENYAPNEYTFEYIKKRSVYYKVRFVDRETMYQLEDDIILSTNKASVSENAPFIPAYMAERATMSLVLSASTKTDPDDQREEELRNNVITFYYTKNDSDYLYEVKYFTRDLNSDSYSLFVNEELTVPIVPEPDPTIVSVAALYSRQYPRLLADDGYTLVAGATTVTEMNVEPYTYGVADDGYVTISHLHRTVINIYFDRKTYNYSYQYIDYRQEQLYNQMLSNNEDVTGVWNGIMYENENAGSGEVEAQITIDIPKHYTHNETPYTRIDNKPVKVVISPDENNATANLVKVYYKRFTERELRYKLICANEAEHYTEVDYVPNTTEPLYGGLSMTMQTIDSYNAIANVIFYNYNEATVDEGGADDGGHKHLHRYSFLGWYSRPERGENDAYRLTTNETLTKADLGLAEGSIPEDDSTYYALVEQDMVWANFEFRCVNTSLPIGIGDGETTEDIEAAEILSAAESDDGTKTGAYFFFTSPNNYVNNTLIPWHRTDGYSMEIRPKDSRIYKYEFSEWWGENLSNGHLRRMKNWNNSGEWSPTVLSSQVLRNQNNHIIAVYKKSNPTSMNYEIKYRFKTRSNGVKDFVKKGTLNSDQLKNPSIINTAATYELTDDFILGNAPYESNHGETLCWTTADTKITRTSDTSTNTMYTVITAEQSKRKVHAHYRLAPTGEYTTMELYHGDNYILNSKMLVLNAPEEYDGKKFSYWAVRKEENGKLVAKCHERLFNLCMMGDYYLSPVYAGDGTEDTNTVTLDRSGLTTDNAENWLAWTWYDGEKKGEGKVVTPSSDLLFTNLRDNVIFVRVDTVQTTINEDWSNVWNQTDDLTVTNGGTFKLTGWKGDNNETMDGKWIRGITLEHLDYSRNRWTDDYGVINNSGETDRLYTDFEISFGEDFEELYQNSSYKTGVVYEYCKKLSADNVFDPDTDYKYKSNESNLAQAVIDNANVYYYNAEKTKRRSIIVNELPMEQLTNKNRINAYLGLYNNIKTVSGNTENTNASYLFKATAYVIDNTDSENPKVYFSNSLYTNLRAVSKKDFAAGETVVIPETCEPTN